MGTKRMTWNDDDELLVFCNYFCAYNKYDSTGQETKYLVIWRE